MDVDQNPSLKTVLIFAAVILFLWAGSGVVVHNLAGQELGTFGDMFGAINALFSGLAFGGVIYAILLQRNELKLQRAELQLTRQELSGSRAAQEDQVKILSKSAEVTALTVLVNDASRRVAERRMERARSLPRST